MGDEEASVGDGEVRRGVAGCLGDEVLGEDGEFEDLLIADGLRQGEGIDLFAVRDLSCLASG